MQETLVHFLGQEDSLETEWQLTPVFLLGESHGQRSLAGYIQSMGSQDSDRSLKLLKLSNIYERNKGKQQNGKD